MAKSKKAAPATPPKKRGRPKKNKKTTYVAIVVDRSGSMGSVADAAFSGINEQIETLKNTGSKGGETFVTYIQFNDIVDLVFDKKPSNELTPLTRGQYQPQGSTAMYDAVWTAIKRLQDGVTETEDTGYLVVVISDGEENSSRDVTAQALAEEITRLQATGKWTVAYMLSNQDLTKVRRTLGLRSNNISAYQSTSIGTTTAFLNVSANTANYMTLREAGETATMNFYNNDTTAEDEK